MWKEALLAATRRPDSGLNGDPEGAFYKIQIDGLPSDVVSQLRVTSGSDPSDYYDDEFLSLPDRIISRYFGALYSADDAERKRGRRELLRSSPPIFLPDQASALPDDVSGILVSVDFIILVFACQPDERSQERKRGRRELLR